MVTCFHSRGFFFFAEYATVGYMAKRIQMRKNRFQKIAESMKAASENPGPPRVPGDHGDHAPKQTVSNVGQSAVVPDFLFFHAEYRFVAASEPGNETLLLPWTTLHAFFQRVGDRLCRHIQTSIVAR